MLIPISSWMFSFITLIGLQYRQLYLLVRESGLFNSDTRNGVLPVRITCSHENRFVCSIYSKQQWTPYVYPTASPRNVRNTKHGPLNEMIVPGYIHNYFAKFRLKIIRAQHLLNQIQVLNIFRNFQKYSVKYPDDSSPWQ